MKSDTYTIYNYTPRQLKLPIEISKLIDVSDPVYTFCDIMDHVDLSKYFAAEKGCKTGRPKYDAQKLLKVILFSFMENGFCSLRTIEKYCKTDIRYMYLLDGMKAPSFMTIGNFIRDELTDTMENIFADINKYIFECEHVDTEHTYIDGTKLQANANCYTWVWKRSCTTNRDKVFTKISRLIDEMNEKVLCFLSVKLEKRETYAIEYITELLETYKNATELKEEQFVSGKGHRKSLPQRQYQELQTYQKRLKAYADHIEICGEHRNSYSKTDHDATFMRLKRDYMGNDQLLPAYNLQAAICDEYIAAVDVKPYASDSECFVPLMEKFKHLNGNYPKYPVADAGYGSYNNYLYCEEHGMEKFMKFTMFKKETKNKKYHEDPYRSVNFKRDENGSLICPNGKHFIYKCTQPVKGNKYGRTEEIYECESCEGCPYKKECCPRAKKNRTIRLNQELTSIHEEVIDNLESVHGALLRMNRSIQSEGTFGIIKWDRAYKRLFRRGSKNVYLELLLVSCGFNLCKCHNKARRINLAA
ncbi:MAG: transposase [Bacillota bacterium]|nr:transposase [Bacillota bacterium]